MKGVSVVSQLRKINMRFSLLIIFFLVIWSGMLMAQNAETEKPIDQELVKIPT